MDFVKSYCGKNEPLSKSVQLVRGSFLSKYFLQNPYFRYMKVKRTGVAEILRKIWLFSAKKIETSESVRKQSAQLKLELNSSLQQKLGTHDIF